MTIFCAKSAALLALLLFALAAPAQVTLVSPVKQPPANGSLLPTAFSGWQKLPGARSGTVPQHADPAQAALLQEAGMIAFERATYTRQGRRAEVKAFRFHDATGAFAAYSGMQNGPLAPEKFCELSGSSGPRALMACTNLVVDVTFDKVTPMAPAELRSLVAQLPKATGTAALAPAAPRYLPELPDGTLSGYRFALGPAGLAHTRTPLPAEVVDFSKSAEVVVADVSAGDETALLTIIRYPTFALATDRQKAIDEWGSTVFRSQRRPAPAKDAQPGSQSVSQPSNTFYTRRIGPLVAVVSGTISEPEARTLAEQIPYDVEITPNEATAYNPKENIGNLVVNMLYLSFIVIGFTLVAGVALGGIRLLAHKYFPGRFFDRPENVEFIKLDLRD